LFLVPENPKKISSQDLLKLIAVVFPAVLFLYLILMVQEKEIRQDQIAAVPSRDLVLLEQQMVATKQAIQISVVEEARADLEGDLDESVPEELTYSLKNGYIEKMEELRENLIYDIQDLEELEMNKKNIPFFVRKLRFYYGDEILAPAYQELPEHQEFVNLVMERLTELHVWRRANPDDLPISVVSSYTEFSLVGQDIIVLIGRNAALENWAKAFLNRQAIHPDCAFIIANMDIMEALARGFSRKSDWPYIRSQMRFIMERIRTEIPVERRGEIQAVDRFIMSYLD